MVGEKLGTTSSSQTPEPVGLHTHSGSAISYQILHLFVLALLAGSCQNGEKCLVQIFLYHPAVFIVSCPCYSPLEGSWVVPSTKVPGAKFEATSHYYSKPADAPRLAMEY